MIVSMSLHGQPNKGGLAGIGDEDAVARQEVFPHQRGDF
jgi:hypothetical protein